MSSTEDLDYPQQLLDYINGYFVSKTMFTGCELGVFDLLHEVGDSLTTANIASCLGSSVDGTGQLLMACVGLKLLKSEMKNDEAYYSNTDLSTIYLVKSSPKSLYPMMIYHSKILYTGWQFLLQAVREGKNQYERALGVTSEDLFGAVYRSDDDLMKFVSFMDSIANMCGKYVLQAFDLSMFHTACDVGGCSGSLAKQFVSIYPGSTATIMDLPNVIQTTKKYFITDRDQPISFLEGDFFKDPIPEADLYILSMIIHDWTQEKCHLLLNKIYQSCRPGGGVLLVETLLKEDKSGPVATQLSSLNMLVHTEGKERTPSEYTQLLADSGFSNIQVKVTGKLHDAILGRKLA